MGITILLRFALFCIDLLAWPAIALGYPLFASIRAVESDSKYHMKKLVIYWTLFSLFSLFEFAFGKIIEWMPLWSSVRLVVIFWLVMPQFDGACHAYQGLVRPVLLVKVQAVIDRFYKLKEARFCKRESFLDVVEKCIKENGSNAVEELIALEHESQKCIKSQRDDTKLVDSASSKQVSYAQSTASLNQTDAATNVKERTPPQEIADDRHPETPPITKTQPEWTRDLCKVTAMSETLLNAHLQGRKHKSKLKSLKARMLCVKDREPSPLVSYAQSTASLNQTDAVTNVKETKPPQEIADDRHPETPPITKTQPEWTCDICKVTAMSETVLNAHLQGIKHKSKLESLKASMLCAKDRGPSPLVKETTPSKETAEKRCPETSPLKKAQQEWTCDLSKVTTTSEIMLNGHLRGSRHMSKLETLKASKDKDPSKVNHGIVRQKFIKKSGSELGKLVESKVQIEAKETTPPKARGENKYAETPSLKQAQQEWTCHLCKVTATSMKNLKAHFKGSKHMSNLESLKMSKLRANDAGLPSSATCKGINQGNMVGTEAKDGEGSVNRSSTAETFKHRCFVCDVTVLSVVDWASHVKGKRHSSNIEALIS